MGDTLSTQLTAWRGENQNHVGLLSKLNINGSLYDIKDPAIEYLADEIESRLSYLETSTIRSEALTKGQDAGQFATSVTQGVDGQISVTYSDVAAEDVTFSESGWTADDAKAAILEALSKAIGTNADTASDDTIKGAKAYALDLVNNLAGADWAANAKKVQEIIAELENSDNANAWATAIDKLAGLDIKYTQAEADAYNANLTGAISTSTTLTAEQATALNGLSGVSSTTYEAGQTPTAADAALYNASLEGAKSTSSTKTPQTVKQYVDAAVAAASSSASDAIAALDATVGSQTVATGKHVAVEVVEADGLLTGLTVTEDDIASATALTALTDTVEEHSEVTAAALTDLNTRISYVESNLGSTDLTTALATKANKAAIGTGSVNNWTASYTSGTETVTWTSVATDVYVPVSGQSL